jgi:hypothetical protein
MDTETKKELSQGIQNWRLAVDLANTWRKMLKVPTVNYPYPGDPSTGLRIRP